MRTRSIVFRSVRSSADRISNSGTKLGRSATRLASVLVCSWALLACSGGGSSTPTAVAAADPLAPSPAVELATALTVLGIETGGEGGDSAGDAGVAGAAGDGAPLKGAVVTLIDAKGVQVSGLTDSAGNFLMKFKSANITAPLVLRVVDAGGNVLSSVSADSAAVGKVIRANINPLTDKITSDVLNSTVVGTDKTFDGSKVDLTKLAKATADLVASVKDALAKAGIADSSKFDPMKSVYKYDGTGVDAVIESISHSRDPVTGATQLRAKLVALSNSADGTVVPTLISASTPLSTTLVATADSPTLTFGKLNSWITAANRCLAMSNTDANADANCRDGTSLVLPGYMHNSMDFSEHFKTLFSAPDRGHIQGSSFRNPTLLFTTKYADSTASYDDAAVVEITIRQPSTGSLPDPIEYTKTLIFKRDDSLSAAAAGNWILNGNQRSYNLSVATRYKIEKQMNAVRANNTAGGQPDTLQSRLNFSINKYRFDRTAQTWVDAGIRAVRVTGPGLPQPVTSGGTTTPGGIVMVPSTAIGQNVLAVYNTTGVVPTSTPTTNATNSSYGLAAIMPNGTALYDGYFSTNEPNNSASTMLTDFSSLQAYSRYKFEIFLTSNTSGNPDGIEYSYNLAPVFSPIAMLTMPLNDITPSEGLVQPTQASSTSVTVAWTNNLNAAPVNSAQVFTQERSPKGATSGFTTNTINQNPTIASAYSLNARPISSAVAAPTGTPFHALTTAAGDFRQIAIWSSQGRADVQRLLKWNN